MNRIALPVSLDDARAHENFVISDAKGDIVCLVPGEPNRQEPWNPPDDPDAKAIAEAIVATLNAQCAQTCASRWPTFGRCDCGRISAHNSTAADRDECKACGCISVNCECEDRKDELDALL